MGASSSSQEKEEPQPRRSTAGKLASGVAKRLSLVKGEVDYDAVRNDLRAIMDSDSYDDGSFAPVLIRLGWHSSGTFSASDSSGGSNGATMRFSPEKDDPENVGLDIARKLLEPVKKKHPRISFSDLWILAAYEAIAHTGGPVISFAPGRRDGKAKDAVQPGRLPGAEHGLGEGLDAEGRINGWENLATHMREVFTRMGLSDREMVALLCGGHVYGRCHPEHSGYAGAWVEEPTKFSNEYAADLLGDEWMFVAHDTEVEGQRVPEETRPAPGKRQYMTAWAPSQEQEKLDELPDAPVEDFPPGQYAVADDWINVRRTHAPESPVIDQPKEGAMFNVLSVRAFGKAVRGQLDTGGWASLVSGGSGQVLLKRVGDVALVPGTYRVLPGAAEHVQWRAAPGEPAGMDAASAKRALAAGALLKVDAFEETESGITARAAGSEHTPGGAPAWFAIVDSKVGALVERVVAGYNDAAPRTGLKSGGLLQVKYQMMLPSDMVLAWDPELRKHVQDYADDEELLKAEFGEAYAKLTTLGVPACPGAASLKIQQAAANMTA